MYLPLQLQLPIDLSPIDLLRSGLSRDSEWLDRKKLKLDHKEFMGTFCLFGAEELVLRIMLSAPFSFYNLKIQRTIQTNFKTSYFYLVQ